MKGVIFMEKKNWSNPELKDCKLVNTHAVDCDCDFAVAERKPDGSKQQHYCHKHGNNGGFVNGNQNGHTQSLGCPEVHYNDAGKVVPCCCYSANSGS